MSISVSLTPNVESLWHSCHALTHEMILTAPGRRIFPTLEYAVSGLEPTKKYAMCMHLELVDNKRLRYTDGGYTESVSMEKKDPPRKVWHNHGVQTGSFWMEKVVNFDQIRVSNKKSVEDKSPSFIHLHTQHRYMPVLSIYTGDEKIQEVRLPHTLFIAVTFYHNNELGTLKTNSNPYATGSRSERRRQREEEAPAQPVKKSKKAATQDFSSMLTAFSPFMASMTLPAMAESVNSAKDPSASATPISSILANLTLPNSDTKDSATPTTQRFGSMPLPAMASSPNSSEESSTSTSSFLANLTLPAMTDSVKTSTTSTPNPLLSLFPFMNPFLCAAMGQAMQLPTLADCFPTPSPSITPASAPISPKNAPKECSAMKSEPEEEEIEVV